MHYDLPDPQEDDFGKNARKTSSEHITNQQFSSLTFDKI